MIDNAYLETVFATLRSQPHILERLDPGLTDSEVDAVQRKFGFDFPPDLRAFLQYVLPIGKGFPNWRDDSDANLRYRLDGPLDGIWFDVEQAGWFWLAEWGPKPAEEQARFQIVKSAVASAPRLIPIFVHRYIPAEPNDAGNPVFSVHQTDIIYYGNDLADYFHHEFGVPLPEWAARTPRPIRFWDDALRWRD
jgi:hypothetical protein